MTQMIKKVDLKSTATYGEQVCRAIVEAIVQGAFKPGDLVPSIPEMARYHGISPKPVQDVYKKLVSLGILTTRNGVGTKVSDNIREISWKLKDETISRLFRRREDAARTVCLLLATTNISWFDNLAEDLSNELFLDGMQLALHVYSHDYGKLDSILDALSEREDLHKIILCPLGSDLPPKTFAAVRRLQNKIVFIDNWVEGIVSPCLMFDHYRTGTAAAKLLREKGHGKILYVSGIEGHLGCHLSERGFADYFSTRDPGAAIVVRRTDFKAKTAESVVLTALRDDSSFTAIVCASSTICLGCMSALKALHIPVPEKVSLLSLYGNDFLSHMGISAVNPATEELASKLMRIIRSGETQSDTTLIFPAVLEGSSITDRKSIAKS